MGPEGRESSDPEWEAEWSAIWDESPDEPKNAEEAIAIVQDFMVKVGLKDSSKNPTINQVLAEIRLKELLNKLLFEEPANDGQEE